MSAPNQLSFLPDDYLARKAIRRTNVIFALLFLITVGASGAAFTHAKKGVKLAREANDIARTDKAQAARPIEQFQKLQEKQRTMAMQAELTSSLIEKVPRSFLLAEMTNSLPTGVSLVDLVLESRKRQPASAAPAPKTTFEVKTPGQKQTPPQVQPVIFDVHMKVTGVAANDVQVAQFITKLNASRLVRDVNLVISDEFKNGENKLRKFQIEMSLDPAAEIDPMSGDHQTKTAAIDLTEKK
ncbi:MAG TPA: PilN domain-containing protein [Tepidisphaeraceae bacterium]|nr:PilN domain-containing protein [Tepidisphaeraceae bacterium]